MNESENLSILFDRLINDFKTILTDGQQLLKATTKEGDEALVAWQSRLNERLENAREQLSHVENIVKNKTKIATNAVEELVQENPWRSIILVGGVAALFGYLAGRIGSTKR